MRRKTKQAESEGETASWILSYGDMMSLLLTFFILIVSFSAVELIKFRQAMGSLRGSTGVLMEQDGDAVISQEHSMFENPLLDKEIMLKALSEIEAQVFEMDSESQEGIDIEITPSGIRFRIRDVLMFQPGSAEIKPGVYRILKSIGYMILRFECDVKVEGHTDNLPIYSSKYPSNWELSTQRAVNVIKYFVQDLKINPTRFMAIGCAEYQPMAPNDTPENRSRNRRVELFLSWKTVSRFIEG